MATSAEYAAFVCEQLEHFGAVRSRKMFGEYMVYLNEKPILTVCDNMVYVKKLPELEPLMLGADCGCPYDGAKEHYILDTEDRERMERVIPALEALTLVPKPKRKKDAQK